MLGVNIGELRGLQGLKAVAGFATCRLVPGRENATTPALYKVIARALL